MSTIAIRLALPSIEESVKSYWVGGLPAQSHLTAYLASFIGGKLRQIKAKCAFLWAVCVCGEDTEKVCECVCVSVRAWVCLCCRRVEPRI